MASNSDDGDNSDSSLDSDLHLYMGTMEEFRIKRGRIHAKAARKGKMCSVRIEKMSEIDASHRSEWSSVRNAKRIRLRKTAKSWTSFFLAKDILLQGSYQCANLLRTYSFSHDPLIVKADSFFPYCSDTDREVNGYVVDDKSIKSVVLIHLSNNTSRRIKLEAGKVYLLGSSPGMISQSFDSLCSKLHDIHTSACAQGH
ncbi:hypothetical protein FGB62_40g06 [Gracilaria domingensis]|nr:hypothetical protein FGB62_40g06 [Gracilaria domingensis]